MKWLPPHPSTHMGVSKIVVPQNGWFTVITINFQTLLKWMIWGDHYLVLKNILANLPAGCCWFWCSIDTCAAESLWTASSEGALWKVVWFVAAGPSANVMRMKREWSFWSFEKAQPQLAGSHGHRKDYSIPVASVAEASSWRRGLKSQSIVWCIAYMETSILVRGAS